MKHVRPAGFNERRCIARDSLCLYGTIVTFATYHKISSNEKPVSLDGIYKVLKQCIFHHPALGTVVQNFATEKPWLAHSSTIDLARHVHIVGDVKGSQYDFRSILEVAHNTPLSKYEEQPHWKVYIAFVDNSRFHLAFASSHALVDGRSGLFFHRSFVEALNDLDNLPFDSAVMFTPASAKNVLPPLEIIRNLSISWTYLLGPLMNEYMPTWLVRALGMEPATVGPGNAGSLWVGASTRPAKSPKDLPTTAVHIVDVPYDIVRSTLEACKSRSARLTGLLLHLTALSLTHALQLQGQEHRTFKVDTSIDLRRMIPEARDTMGVLVSSSDEVVTLPPAHPVFPPAFTDADWAAVRATTTRLETASGTLADQPVGLLRYLSNYRDWTARKARSPARSSFEISNLGRFEGGLMKNWEVERVSFSQSADATGSPFSINVASVDGGPLVIVLSWWPGMLGVKDEKQLAKDVCEGIMTGMRVLND